MISISQSDARRIAVRAQDLHQRHITPLTARGILQSLGCIQLDTIHTIRRSHELVLLARGASAQEAAGFLQHSPDAVYFEYWAHAASLVPIELWPLFAFRRRRFQTDGWRGPVVDPAAVRWVRGAIENHGKVTVTELGGAKGSGWERNAPAKWAAEWLLATGELICVDRRSWSRIYRMSSSVLPDTILQAEPDDEYCIRTLIGIALKALGIGTSDDISDYFRLPRKLIEDFLKGRDDLVRVAVDGWNDPAWSTASALEDRDVDENECTPLSPFDPLVWHRPRTKRLFGIDYTLEAYKPATARRCGYFGMPVLHGSEITGRIALRRSSGQSYLEGYEVANGAGTESLHRAIHIAAKWSRAQTMTASPLCDHMHP